MSVFDWGVFKPGGDAILVVSSSAYAASVALAGLCTLQIWRRGQGPQIAVGVAVFAVLPMAALALVSIATQLSSAHYQQTIHVPAILGVGGGLLASSIAWYAGRGRSKQADPKRRPEATDTCSGAGIQPDSENPYASPGD